MYLTYVSTGFLTGRRIMIKLAKVAEKRFFTFFLNFLLYIYHVYVYYFLYIHVGYDRIGSCRCTWTCSRKWFKETGQFTYPTRSAIFTCRLGLRRDQTKQNHRTNRKHYIWACVCVFVCCIYKSNVCWIINRLTNGFWRILVYLFTYNYSFFSSLLGPPPFIRH